VNRDGICGNTGMSTGVTASGVEFQIEDVVKITDERAAPSLPVQSVRKIAIVRRLLGGEDLGS